MILTLPPEKCQQELVCNMLYDRFADVPEDGDVVSLKQTNYEHSRSTPQLLKLNEIIALD